LRPEILRDRRWRDGFALRRSIVLCDKIHL
jgi:hypothetical protein